MPLGKSGFADKRVNSEIVSKSIAELKRTAEGKKVAKTSWSYTPENWEQQDKDAVQVNAALAVTVSHCLSLPLTASHCVFPRNSTPNYLLLLLRIV